MTSRTSSSSYQFDCAQNYIVLIMYDSDDFTDLGPKVDNIDIEEVSLDVKMRSIDSILLKLGDPIEDKVKDKTMWRIDIV
jgi:hypothetical protein